MALKLPARIVPFFYRLRGKMTGNEIHSLPNDYNLEVHRNYDRHYAHQ